MPIDVVANGTLTLASLKDRKKFPKRKKKPFASTVLGGIRVTDVEIDCQPVVPESTACDCRATRVTLEVECCVGLNRRKIQRGYFDPLLKRGEDGSSGTRTRAAGSGSHSTTGRETNKSGPGGGNVRPSPGSNKLARSRRRAQ